MISEVTSSTSYCPESVSDRVNEKPETSFKLKWPEDLRDIGLSALDIRVIETAILSVRESVPSNTEFNGGMGFGGGRVSCESDSTIKRGAKVTLSPSESGELKRTIVVYKNRSLVLLKPDDKTPLKGGAGQKTMKWAYDPDSGNWFLKKRPLSIAQETLIRFITGGECLEESNRRGFAEISHYSTSNGKMAYFERYYPDTIASVYKRALPESPTLDMGSLMALQNSLCLIHQMTFSSPKLQLPNKTCAFQPDSGFYHGDIAPQNIVSEPEPDHPNYFSFKLINWRNAVNLECIQYTPGWGSPECVKRIRSDDDTFAVMEFNKQYGAKKDTWAFGLLVGSILRGGFVFDKHGRCLPKFSFICNKITFSKDDEIDDSKITELKQKEIDAEIKEIVETLDLKTSIGKCIAIWWEVISQWLQVDPDTRKTVAECHVAPVDS